MPETISANQLAYEIKKQLQEYTEEVSATTNEIALDVSGKAVKKLRENSPKSKNGGEYAKNWTRTSTKNDITVYNKAPTYRLTHLLEKGHQLRRGGRKIGEVPAYPHIEEVEVESVKEYIEQVERRL